MPCTRRCVSARMSSGCITATTTVRSPRPSMTRCCAWPSAGISELQICDRRSQIFNLLERAQHFRQREPHQLTWRHGWELLEVDAADAALLEHEWRARADEESGQPAEVRFVAHERDAFGFL